MSGTGSVGASIPRVDGVAKVRGSALYVDDLHAPDALHGMTVRSKVAHGVLRAIHLDPSFDWSDVTVVTAADIPGKNAIYMYEYDQPALVPVGAPIRHFDEPVALVAAPTRRKALEARDHVRLEVDERPAVLSLDDAVSARVHLVGDDNVFKRVEIHRGGDVSAALATADVVIEGDYFTPAQEQMYIEPQGMMAHWEGGRCHLIGSLQCPYYAHRAIKELLGLPDDDLVITQAVTGGAFGGKEEYPSMIGGHVALLALKAKRQVKIIYDREEDIAATTKRHPCRIRHRLGLRRDGTFVACDVNVLFDGGAYLTVSPVVLSRGVLHSVGPYRFPNVRVVGRMMATNHPPHGAFRGFGAPQTTFAYERQVAKAARALGMDPFELRRKNMLRSGDQTATGQTLTYSVGSEPVLDEVEKAARARPLLRDSGGGAAATVRRGRGLCFYFHGAGFTGSGESKLAGRASMVALGNDSFEVRTSCTDMGQGAATILAQIAATALEVPVERVRVIEPQTGLVPNSGPTVASRTCMIVGGLVDRAARGLLARRAEWRAGEETIETVQFAAPEGIEWDEKTFTGAAYSVYGWAACMVDVAVDLDTYEVAVERCVHAVDVGKAIHPIIVKGQIEGGTLQALGWALIENVLYQRGQVANRTMTNCIVPTAADAPEMETILVECPYPFGPHGAKGVGEIPMDGPAAAVADAVADALGVEFDNLPVSPESIARALAEVRS